jgi:hypothetical protein
MNKSILLQSIKSVSGFLAILFIALSIFVAGMTYIPYVTIPLVIVGIFSLMVYMEYKNRKNILEIENYKK